MILNEKCVILAAGGRLVSENNVDALWSDVKLALKHLQVDFMGTSSANNLDHKVAIMTI
jgi:hypothetical protein